MVSEWPQSVVARCGRTLERARFRKTGGHGAREEALTAAGLRQSSGGVWEANPDADFEELGRFSLAQDFEEVPAVWLGAKRWQKVSAGKWRDRENILVL